MLLQQDVSQVVSLLSEVLNSRHIKHIIGGASVAFKNAMVGGVILALIEGVSTVVTSISMRQ